MPLHYDGERVGVLCIGDHKPRDFDAEILGVLSDLAALAERELHIAALSEVQIALARSNEELEMKSRIDVLTHLWNRGAILEIVAAERARAATGAPTAILMIDVDHFKVINDTFGHTAGDEVLRVVAARLRVGVRPLDAVGRYGGEEFLAVLPDVGIEEAIQAGERICRANSTMPIHFGQHTIPVTCSIGCAAVCDASDDANTLIQRADRALYRAKLSGRNRVEVEAAIPMQIGRQTRRDQPGSEILPHRGNTASDLDVPVARGPLREPQCLFNPASGKVESRPALHHQRRPLVVRQHESWRMVGGLSPHHPFHESSSQGPRTGPNMLRPRMNAPKFSIDCRAN